MSTSAQSGKLLGGSAFSGLLGAARFSNGEVIFTPDQPKFWLCQHPCDEGIVLGDPLGQVLASIDFRIDRATKPRAHRLKRSKNINIGQSVADQHQVNVARRRILPLGD